MNLKELVVTLKELGIKYPKIIETSSNSSGTKTLIINLAVNNDIDNILKVCKGDYKERVKFAKELGYKVKVSKAKGFYYCSKNI